MKNLALALGLICLSSTSFASVKLKCPAGSREILKCVSANQPKDAVNALNFMDGALICARPNQAMGMIFSIPGSSRSSEVFDVREVSTIGGTSYTAFDRPELSIIRYNHAPGATNATFNIYKDGIISTRTLICN